MVPGGTAVRRSIAMLWDALAWLLAVAVVTGSRYEFYLDQEQWTAVLIYASLACASQGVVGTLLKLYRGKYRVGTFEESLGLVLDAVVVGMFLALTFLTVPALNVFPRGIAFLAPPLALLLMAAGRWGY